ILWVVPVVVISVLLLSLLESFLILPAHLSGGSLRRKPGGLNWIQDRLRSGLQWVVDRIYAPTLAAAMRFRYVTMAIAFVCSLLTAALIQGGHVRVVFFPQIDSDEVSARLEMVGGTSAVQTQAVLDHMLTALEDTRKEVDSKLPPGEDPVLRNVAATLGAQPFGSSGGPSAGTGGSGSNVAEIALELTPGEVRSVSATSIVGNWRKRIGEIPGVNSLTFNSSRLSAGDDISVELAHADFEKLLEATEQVKLYLAEFEGVNEIADSFQAGKRELNFELTPAGLAAGLTRQELARQVRQAYYGEEAQRVQRGRDDIKVLVRYTEDERRNIASLDNLRIRTANGQELPLSTVATYTEQRGYASIQRTDRRRIVRVTANVDDEVATPKTINDELKQTFLPHLAQAIPGLTYSFEGQERERMDSIRSLAQGLLIALFGIFALIAVQLKSYTQPLVILAVIPLGFVGAVLAHMLLGYSVSFFSMFGVVALSGVVINDGLVLLDLINRRIGEGFNALEAITYAGPRRFRPILFTSLTTCVGLGPIVFEKSMQAQFLIPMAISLAGGVAFATLITLYLVPALVLFREDVFALGRKLRTKMFGEEPEASAEVAS
ncbi:MAG TPA: efflux RND transporter permease subunit, partial [Planctomycetota bacterium]|nr:efflux RND transporter permease subunit [Planctomycetota bacterium]